MINANYPKRISGVYIHNKNYLLHDIKKYK